MAKSDDPFARPPKRDRSAQKVEDAACRRALKTAGISPSTIYRASGLSASGLLTFGALVEYAGFPITPSVTAEPLDDMLTLMTKLSKSRLAKAWFEAWAARPRVRQGERMMVMRGSLTGFVVVYDAPVPPERPHLSLGFRRGLVLRVEILSAWCRGISWAEGPVT